jgi:hypothetical protein
MSLLEVEHLKKSLSMMNSSSHSLRIVTRNDLNRTADEAIVFFKKKIELCESDSFFKRQKTFCSFANSYSFVIFSSTITKHVYVVFIFFVSFVSSDRTSEFSKKKREKSLKIRVTRASNSSIAFSSMIMKFIHVFFIFLISFLFSNQTLNNKREKSSKINFILMFNRSKKKIEKVSIKKQKD